MIAIEYHWFYTVLGIDFAQNNRISSASSLSAKNFPQTLKIGGISRKIRRHAGREKKTITQGIETSACGPTRYDHFKWKPFLEKYLLIFFSYPLSSKTQNFFLELQMSSDRFCSPSTYPKFSGKIIFFVVEFCFRKKYFSKIFKFSKFSKKGFHLKWS